MAWVTLLGGLLTSLVGELVVFFEHERLAMELVRADSIAAISEAQQGLSFWPAIAPGAAVAAFGLLLLLVLRRSDERPWADGTAGDA